MSGQLTILNAPGSLRKVFSFQVSATQTGFFTATGSAAWDQTTAINAIRFFFTGNMLSGTIRLYGLAK
jgi:hypothetical protein